MHSVSLDEVGGGARYHVTSCVITVCRHCVIASQIHKPSLSAHTHTHTHIKFTSHAHTQQYMYIYTHRHTNTHTHSKSSSLPPPPPPPHTHTHTYGLTVAGELRWSWQRKKIQSCCQEGQSSELPGRETWKKITPLTYSLSLPPSLSPSLSLSLSHTHSPHTSIYMYMYMYLLTIGCRTASSEVERPRLQY